MVMKSSHFLFAAAFALLIFLTGIVTAYAFDVAVYCDVRSTFNQKERAFYRWPNTRHCSVADELGKVTNPDSVWQWYKEMGVTRVMVNYRNQQDWDALPAEMGQMKVMNIDWPSEAFKYLES
jgi:hypothetical protein